jgi:hypothetical protein
MDLLYASRMREHAIREYSKLVAKAWGNHIAGPVAAGLALILPFVNLWWGQYPGITLWVALAPALLAVLLIWPAQYQVWKEECGKRLKAEVDVKSQQNKAASDAIRIAISSLAKLGEGLASRPPGHTAQEDEIEKWRKDKKDWENQVKGRLSSTCGQLACDKWGNLVGLQGAVYPGVHPEVNGDLIILHREIGNLYDIVENTDKYMTEPLRSSALEEP